MIGKRKGNAVTSFQEQKFAWKWKRLTRPFFRLKKFPEIYPRISTLQTDVWRTKPHSVFIKSVRDGSVTIRSSKLFGILTRRPEPDGSLDRPCPGFWTTCGICRAAPDSAPGVLWPPIDWTSGSVGMPTGSVCLKKSVKDISSLWTRICPLIKKTVVCITKMKHYVIYLCIRESSVFRKKKMSTTILPWTRWRYSSMGGSVR